MFLVNLSNEGKKLFLQLCVFAANANGVFEESEKEMIYEYCNEMQIERNIPTISKSLNDLLKDIVSNTSVVERNIMILELIGILYSDGEFDDIEISFLDKCIIGLKIEKHTAVNIKKLFVEYLELYKRMNNAIFGEE